MPRKTDTMKIGCPFMDRRVKLLPCQKEMIHYWHGLGASINSLARMFKVNKRLIQFELFPERKQLNLQHRRDRGGSATYYKGGESWAATIRDHRDYKKELFKDLKQSK